MALYSPFSPFPSFSTGNIEFIKTRDHSSLPPDPLSCLMLIAQSLGRRCHSSVLWMPVAVSFTCQVEGTGVPHGLLPGCGARSRPSENRRNGGFLDSHAAAEAGRVEREKALVGSNSTFSPLMSCPKRRCLVFGLERVLSVAAAAAAARVQERSA